MAAIAPMRPVLSPQAWLLRQKLLDDQKKQASPKPSTKPKPMPSMRDNQTQTSNLGSVEEDETSEPTPSPR